MIVRAYRSLMTPAIGAKQPTVKLAPAAAALPERKAYVPMTPDDVRSIWDARREVYQLSVDWAQHIKRGDHSAAATARRKINKIKATIKERFDIIL